MTETLVMPCPVCGGLTELRSAVLGYELECPDCGEALRVGCSEPLALTYTYDLEDEGEYSEDERRV